MANTTNFNWETPDDTDLVKDGAAAIRTLGNSIDTSFVDLKGGTTGQILSKASDTDLDYTWIANDQGDITEVQAGTGISVASGTGPIPVVTNTVATEFDAKGDLVVGTGSDTFDRLAVGTDGYTLVADSAETTGLKWQAPASSSGPAFRAFGQTSNQSVTADTWTKVQFNAESFDTDNCYDPTTNFRFTANKAGYYFFNTGVLAIAETGKYVQTTIYKNGSVYDRGVRVGATDNEGLSQQGALIYLNGTSDYVEVFCIINAGSVSEAFVRVNEVCYFEGIWIRS